MKRIWRWIKRTDTLQHPLDCQENRFKTDDQLGVRQLKQGLNMGERSSWVFNWLRPPFQFQSQIPLPPISKRCRPEKGERGRIKPAIALTLSIVTLTAAMGQRFYRQPELQVGTFAPKTVFAPESASVIDAETTEAKRTAARNGAVPVLVPNEEKDRQIQNSLNSVFKQVDIVRKEAGDFPFFAVNRLTTATQQYIQETPSSEWNAVWAVVEDVVTKAQADNATSTDLESRLTDHSNFWALSTQQQWIVRDLMRYQQQRSLAALQSLKGQIDNTRANYQAAILRLQNLAAAERGLPNDAELLRLSDAEWAKIQKNLHRVLNNMLLQGIAEGVPREQLRVAGRAQLDGVVPEGTEALANALLMVVLEPNLEKDLEKTRAKAEAAAEQVNEVLVTVEDGEVIIYQGEIIGQSDFVLLDHFELSQRRLNIWGLMGFGVLVAGVTGLFLLAERTVRPALRKQDHGLIIFMLLGVSGLSVVGLAVYSLPAVGLLISSFYGATLGSTLIGALAILLPIGTQVSEISLLASAAGALVCSLIAPRLRSREEIALLGGIVGLIQGTVYLALTWVMSPVSVTTWLPLTGAILQGVYGIVSSVIALGLSPYLEHLFDLVTPIRLAELSSPNRPTLKRLASEAPGTFQHTLFVASLAEAAARALSCNVELVRAGTLYHDIGKMHDPLGFIENQMGGPNKHDEIADPWVSADIIKKHVSEGLVMARRCRLPKAVRAFIPEHQGNMLISYFYHQAKERAKVDTHLVVNEKDFRYDGPIPQSPETGIVMLADSCEAALRSLKDASTEEALAMVNRILKARWRDQQLVDSGLTREHMGMIAQVFVQVWQQYNHKRIAYPKNSLSPIINRS